MIAVRYAAAVNRRRGAEPENVVAGFEGEPGNVVAAFDASSAASLGNRVQEPGRSRGTLWPHFADGRDRSD